MAIAWTKIPRGRSRAYGRDGVQAGAGAERRVSRRRRRPSNRFCEETLLRVRRIFVRSRRRKWRAVVWCDLYRGWLSPGALLSWRERDYYGRRTVVNINPLPV